MLREKLYKKREESYTNSQRSLAHKLGDCKHIKSQNSLAYKVGGVKSTIWSESCTQHLIIRSHASNTWRSLAQNT